MTRDRITIVGTKAYRRQVINRPQGSCIRFAVFKNAVNTKNRGQAFMTITICDGKVSKTVIHR